MTKVSSEVPPSRSLADDPNFLESLSDLDLGISETPAPGRAPHPSPRASPRDTPPPASSTPPLSLEPSPAPPGSHHPRRLLELFPTSSEVESAASNPGPVSRGEARGLRAAHPPRLEPYETYYDLSERPFGLAPDLRFLYHSTAHDRASQAMLDAIRRRDGIFLLTGEMGIGKTLLCQAVMEQLDRRTLISLVADPFTTSEELLKTVLVDFGVISHADRSRGRLAQASRADLSAALRDFLYSLAPLQAFAVVIVDEAHRLSTGLLDEIGVLADTGGDERLLQVMLVGQPPLSRMLSTPALQSLSKRVAARTTLGPLTADEVPQYVAHRLEVARGRVDFDANTSAALHALSRGVPRVVNVLCDRALAAGHRASAERIEQHHVRQAAEELDMVPPMPAPSLLGRLAAVLVFSLLVLAGAAAGAYVFRADVAALFNEWRGLR